MSFRPCLLASAIAVSLGTSAYATEQQQTSKHNIEVITITAPTDKPVNHQDQAVGSSIEPDLASWLTSVPGASINRNGPITGIAQYRGMYGDRVAVSVDGHTLIGAGPNAMDTPMSYVTPLIVESMSVFRGITPVSASIDTLGGSIDINMRKAQFDDGNNSFSGEALAGYRGLNKAKTFSSWVNFANQSNGVMVFINSQKGDDYQDGNGDDVLPTRFDKQQAGIDYRFKLDNSEWGMSYHYTKTEDSGTPALPMDIGYIKGKRLSLDGTLDLGDWQANWLVGHLDAKHGMDNFSMRTNMNMAMYRHNYAVADTIDFRLHLSQNNRNNSNWSFGIDGYMSDHDSTITNPNNMMFNVANFNHVENDRIGLFFEWQVNHNDINYSLGARIKHINSDAGEVSHHMQGANMMVDTLVARINDVERNVSDTLLDIAINSQYNYSDNLELYAGLGLKQRAPSYQQRYLWMPMEATGGLADGKTYVGNINLDNETAYQLDLGMNYQAGDFYLSPHVYYQSIDDYIQGVTATHPAIKMMANMMMGDESPLVFANIDAEIYGMDIRWYTNIDQNWRLSGVASYVRGKQQDINDDLYRIAPLNGEIALSYQADNWHSKIGLHGFAKQDKVSALSQEQTTSGYALVNWSMSYYLADNYTLRAGVDNLLDRQYYSHLSGYNRPLGAMDMNNGMDMDNNMDGGMNMDNGMDMGDDMNNMGNGLQRLPGLGRNAFIELDVKF